MNTDISTIDSIEYMEHLVLVEHSSNALSDEEVLQLCDCMDEGCTCDTRILSEDEVYHLLNCPSMQVGYNRGGMEL